MNIKQNFYTPTLNQNNFMPFSKYQLFCKFDKCLLSFSPPSLKLYARATNSAFSKKSLTSHSEETLWSFGNPQQLSRSISEQKGYTSVINKPLALDDAVGAGAATRKKHGLLSHNCVLFI